MTVYVDDQCAGFGRMKMSHMIATTDAELHAMADLVGVARRWHQAPPEHDSHYDICKSKRRMAIAAGAVAITVRQCACMNRRRIVTGSLGDPLEAEDWFIEHRRKARAQ